MAMSHGALGHSTSTPTAPARKVGRSSTLLPTRRRVVRPSPGLKREDRQHSTIVIVAHTRAGARPRKRAGRVLCGACCTARAAWCVLHGVCCMPLLVAGGARVNVSVDVEGSWDATGERACRAAQLRGRCARNAHGLLGNHWTFLCSGHRSFRRGSTLLPCVHGVHVSSGALSLY